MKTRLTLLAAMLLAGCGAETPRGPASDAAIAALAGAEAQFRSILPRAIFATQSMAMASYNLGIAENCAIVRPQFDAAINRHLPAWRSNLVKAYRDNVPEAKLAKVAAEGKSGLDTLRPYIAKIAAQMQATSMPLLQEAAADVVTPSVEAGMKIEFKSVDGAARQREMEAAKADGTLFCGLLTSQEMK
ncbi:MAG: hypothetical protein H7268_02265 [Sandarakinorhabdus sp.]|nr:hypothetical protein [Sandarakinorhabdus sp.]